MAVRRTWQHGGIPNYREALSGHGKHVTKPQDIRPALERALNSGNPACVNVELEQDQEYRGGGYV